MNFGLFLVLMAIASTAAFRPVPLRQGVKFGARVTSVRLSAPDSDANTSPEGGTPDNEVEEVLESEVMETPETEEEAEEASGEGDESEEAEEEPEESPLDKAIKEKESELAKELADIEGKLRTERLSTMKTKDKLSESGKTGFFMVQAQVAEFLKKKDTEQKGRVAKNKKDFVNKILPVVDAFNAAPINFPAETEREENMHKSFGSLVSSIMIVFEKYGVKEYVAEEGGKLDSYLHQVERVEEGEEDGKIIQALAPGYKDSEGDVIRRALVVASKKPGSEPAPEPEAEHEAEPEAESEAEEGEKEDDSEEDAAKE